MWDQEGGKKVSVHIGVAYFQIKCSKLYSYGPISQICFKGLYNLCSIQSLFIPLGTSCAMWIGSVLRTTSYPTESISQAERRSRLILLPCSDSVCFTIVTWFLCFYCGWAGYVLKWFLFLSFFQKWNMSTGCFILKINQILHAVPVPDSMCSVQLDVASVTNRLGAYSPQSRVESRLWDASETRCGMTASKTDLS